jgi:uridine kinase
MDQGAVVDRISARAREADHPIVVGVSGYCGSGKSTLTRSLVATLSGAQRLRGDDFLDPGRSHLRSSDWDGVDRPRLVSTVLSPFRAGRAGTFRRYDWSRRALGPAEPIPRGGILIVDLIGLFHPESLPAMDLTIWCDVDLDTAARRGMARDRGLGRAHEGGWHDVRVPNERDFAERFAPQEAADLLYEAGPSSSRA